VDLDLVLPDRSLVGGQVLEHRAQFGEPDPSLLFARRGDRSRSPVANVAGKTKKLGLRFSTHIV